MRPIARWRHLMSSVVTFEPRTGTDTDTGLPTYGAATTYRAHLSRKRQLVRGEAGLEVDSGQTVHLDAAPAIEPTARITLSTGDVGSTEASAIHPAIVAVERRYDQSGPHHTVVYLE
jgi:hypothetical protein